MMSSTSTLVNEDWNAPVAAVVAVAVAGAADGAAGAAAAVTATITTDAAVRLATPHMLIALDCLF